MANRKFRCTYCGDWFELNDEDNELFEEGYLTHEPDCCGNCPPSHYPYQEEEFSDADNGL